MIGTYDFCGSYEWTFEWLEHLGGNEMLKAYWDEAIHLDSQRHASELIVGKGIEGMKEYWGHSLAQEGAGYRSTATENVFRLDIHECPSKGFLIRNHLQQHTDYCDHCIGWIGPMLKRAGFTIDHQHNHCGQCWWQMHRNGDTAPSSATGEISKEHDARLHPNWKPWEQTLDTYFRATDPNEKVAVTRSNQKHPNGIWQTWEMLPALPVENGNFACGVVGNDIVVAGGITWQEGVKSWLDRVWRFDVLQGKWHEAARLPSSVAYAACGASGKELYLAGGNDSGVQVNGSLDLQLQFHARQDFPKASYYAAAAFAQGKTYMMGGGPKADDLKFAVDDFCAVDVVSGAVEMLPPFPGGKAFLSTMSAMGDHLYVFGGAILEPETQRVVNLNKAYAYSIADRKWTELAPLPFAVRGMASCVLEKDYILLAGGYHEDFSDEALIYDTARGIYLGIRPLPYRAMVNLVKAGDHLHCLGGEDRMKHRTGLCYRIRWQELMKGAKPGRHA